MPRATRPSRGSGCSRRSASSPSSDSRRVAKLPTAEPVTRRIYLELAERGNTALGTAQQVEWLDRFGRENDNFRAVLRRAMRRDDAAVAVRMGRALATYW